MVRQLQLHWSSHLVRMDDERLPKGLFYEDVAKGSRRIPRYKDTLQTSLKRLQINPANLNASLETDRPGGGGKQRQAQRSTTPTVSPPPKPNARLANLKCAHPARPTFNRHRPAYAARGRSGHQSASLDNSVTAAAPGLHQPMSPSNTSSSPYTDK
ncbi:hypothetical protein SprV_0301139800 [Sparganum proliferum]